ncbi:MAG: type II toxin-antitoxin system VapC family toxin [Sulfuricella sp.]|nr:type II toxin-antitoxin system VapC family toxin [Sulfuricella sp.]
MNFMLDTNTCIYLMTDRHPQRQARILARIDELGGDDNLVLSSLVVFELSYGAQKGRWRKANMALLGEFLLDFLVVPFDEAAAHRAGTVRSELESSGLPIGPLDTLIAAHALSLGIPLVTHNVREFARVTGLSVEDWAGE